MNIAENKFQVYRLDGNGTILDVDGQSLSAEFPRLVINMVKYGKGDNKALKTIHIYVDVNDAILLADILSANGGKEIYEACKKGASKALAEGKEYFYAGYDKLGNMGTHANPQKGRECRSRSFRIEKGKKTQYVLVGTEGPGRTIDGKLIVPDGTQDSIYVPASHDDLRKMGLAIKMLTQAYITKQFCMFAKPPYEGAA